MPGIYTSTGPVRKRAVSSRSSRSRLPSGYYRQAPSDPILLSAIKNQLIFRTQLRQLNAGKGRNEQVNIQTMTFVTYAVNEAMQICTSTYAMQ